MTILCTIDLETREVSLPAGQVIASYDHNVDVIRFQAETIPGFSLDTSSIKIAAQGPNKARHDYAVDPSTVQIEEETGYITFDWPIPAGVTEMPIGSGFKYGDKGQLIFAVCAEIISGSTLSKAWHSDDGIITVVAHLEPESGGGEDPEEEATNAQKIGQLQTATAILQREISGIASGTPPTASSTSEMDPDESTVYINTTDGNWYYWNGSAWQIGGVYGGAVTDTTLSISGAAADAKKTGDEITNLKSALSDTNSELFQKSFISNYIAIPTNWQTGQGINPIDGSNLLNNKYCRTGYVSLDYPAIYIELIDSTYEFVVWGYSSTSVNNATYAPKSAYSLDGAILLKKNNSLYFRIGARRKDFADLQSSDITAIAASLKTYSIAYESKSVKKVACFGDSIMWGRDGNGSSSSRVTYTLPKILSEKCGITFDNYGVGGMGYLRPDDADNKIAYDKISETDLSTYDAVLICFGVNDGTYPIGDYDSDDLTTVMGQFNRIINYIYTHYQNKLVFVIAPFNGKNVGTFPDYWYGTHLASNRYSRLILSNSIKRVCEDYSIPYIEQFDSPINAFTITDALPDGVHPSSAYYTKIGHWLAGKLCTLIG